MLAFLKKRHLLLFLSSSITVYFGQLLFDQLRNNSTHPIGDLEACCRPWTRWCSDMMALAGYMTVMTMMT